MNLEAVREHGHQRQFNVHLTQSPLILELVDTIVSRIGVQQNVTSENYKVNKNTICDVLQDIQVVFLLQQI